MKRKMKKKMIRAVIVAFTLFLLVSCGGAEEGKEGTKDGNIELTFVRIGNDQGETDYWKGLISRFEAKYENIKIIYDDAAIGEPMETKLTTMFSGNKGPDLIGHGIMSVASRVEAGHYLPITDYFNKWEGKDDIMASVLANGTYKNDVYGLAYSTTPFILAYRKDLFEQAGLPDRAPETWEELAEYAKKLTIMDGDKVTTAGFSFPMSAGNFVEFDVFAFGNGALYYDSDGTITMNTPAVAETLEFLKPLVNQYNLPFNSNEVNPFTTGRAAMTLINNATLRSVLTNPEYEGKIGIAVPPYNKVQATFSGCNMLFLGRDCQYPDEAFLFMEMALSIDEVMNRAKEINIPVTRTSMVDAFIALDPMNEVRAECVANGIGMPRTIWAPAFQRIRNQMVQEILYGGADISATLAQAQAELESENK